MEQNKMDVTEIINYLLQSKLDKKPYAMVVGKLMDAFSLSAREVSAKIQIAKEEGLLFENDKKQLVNCERAGLIKGVVSGNSRGFAFIEPLDSSLSHLFIAPRNLNTAMHSDTVLVKKIAGKRGDSTEGIVVEVLKRGTDTIVGTIEVVKDYGFLVADNNKFSSDVFIAKNKLLGAKNGQKVVVKITSYAKKSPEGVVIEVLGDKNSPEVELLSIIRSYNLIEEFSNELLDYTSKMELEIKEEDIVGRLDLRKERIFTIDGEDAKDLDDAISIEFNKETGIYKLGVHIADVGHYVKRGNIIDHEALKRGTSVYFPHLVLPMLPRELSNGICSLHPQVDRLTLSIFMNIDKEGKVINYNIAESVINSVERMTYNNVTKILEADIDVCKRYENIKDDLSIMLELSHILEKKRNLRGSLDFDLPETKIVVNSLSYEVEKLERRERQESHRLIESFMLAANETIAEHMHKLKMPFVYRVHEKPSQEKLEAFKEFIAPLGLKIKADKSEITGKDLQLFLVNIANLEYKDVINKVLLRSMQKAKYMPNCLGHYGLAAEYYCHFTSPIRRYPDLTIHRIIKDHLNKKPVLNDAKLKKFVEEASLVSSFTEVQAEKCERDVDDYFKAKYMEDKIGEVYDGTISGVTGFGIFIELDNTVEGFVRLQDLPGSGYNFIENKYTLTNTINRYTMGDKVKIKVVGASREDKRVDFVLI